MTYTALCYVMLVVGGVTVLLVLFFVWQDTGTLLNMGNISETSETDQAYMLPNASADRAPNGYRVVSDTSVGIEVAVPESATTSAPHDTVFSITFIGPDAEADTEITDGFMVTFERDPDPRTASLEAYVDREIASIHERGLLVVTPRAKAMLAGEAAYTYRHETELGTTVTGIISLVGESGYRVTYSIVGSDKDEYQSAIETMLKSLTFTM